MRSGTITLDDIIKDLRAPVIEPERRELFDRLNETEKKHTRDSIMDRNIEPLFNILESITNGPDEYLPYLAKRLATRMHRTLIQSFMRGFIMPFLSAMAEQQKQGFSDLRSEGTGKMAIKMLDAVKDDYLPFV